MIKNKTLSPIYWIPTTWFAMGLPFVALSGASSIMYKNLGISDSQIAFWTSLIMLPWTLKPLWGPFLELYKTKKFFVYITQIFTGVLFGLLALTLQLDHFFSFSIAILTIIAISGATHDTAADGVYLNELSPKLQAKFVGWQGAFYNVAKVFSGGVLVYLAGQLEQEIGIKNAWMVVMFIYGIIMVCLGIYNMRVLPEGNVAKEATSLKEGFDTLKDVIVTFFQKKHIWFSLCFIVFYRFAEGQAIKITPLFFKAARESGGLGLSTSEIGLLYGVFGAVAFVLGSIVAGYYVSNKGLTRRTLLILCAFFNLPFAAYAFLAITTPTNLYVIASAVAIEYFGYGYGFVGLILFMMQNIAPGKYKMAHYAFGSGLMNLGFMIPSMISGFLSDFLGYKEFFIWVLIATIPAFIVTWLVPLRSVEEVEQEAEVTA
ncbi:major facilitator superfamily MFS_1 [Pseudopedobacter saltans DSM 12145]|uniref:Major facilitator superfamily MFS_1 n=1 Tax=Pseudopedobacter saltans (strain ATCC 51119 / DSM 12145 / JCM 21818 / CCUG 39354 / LMG 10337 / NBRC 100064 / NCIMB 13643) TaxID=762903 RepID=F0SC26_PSESL|nr:MFS transporter [Pseudopedobacter saltans]ADY50611.1 major facilitator superfamily MFS_1 [Pseudopedobacter saltans DSM 12145]